VPQVPLSLQEKRLAALCRVLAVLYLAAAVTCAALLGSLSPPAGAEAVLAVAMMTAVATACLVVAAGPRERRHAVLPVVVAQLTTGVLAVAHLSAGHGGAALAVLAAVNLPLFLLTTLAWRAAAPGVRGVSTQAAAPPEAEEPPKIQLKVSKR
jgi:hypothetical protein